MSWTATEPRHWAELKGRPKDRESVSSTVWMIIVKILGADGAWLDTTILASISHYHETRHVKRE
ncbi:hypothetical protein ANCCAN_15249 [Ancylostoma caninum]|uniref:Uncharacterized protein n=1 Tax=Ancylostoma caninum TaxID=29170 RepID=A0A368G304_ANCCA|nr:hypothetical protein ANCCAN_15249 [Ancylostoma caninum]